MKLNTFDAENDSWKEDLDAWNDDTDVDSSFADYFGDDDDDNAYLTNLAIK